MVFATSFQLFAAVGKAQEPVRVQTFHTGLAVERFDETVVGRFAGLGEAQGNIVRVGPEIEVAGDEFGPVVDPDRLGIAELLAKPLNRLDLTLATVCEPGIGRRLPGGRGQLNSE